MTLAEEFLSVERSLKYADHEEIVKAFDAGADVSIIALDNSGEVYSDHTVVTFSDGSECSFNYKGEEDWLHTVTHLDEIKRLQKRLRGLTDQLNDIAELVEDTCDNSDVVSRIAEVLNFEWRRINGREGWHRW
jgi:hypothetical protein